MSHDASPTAAAGAGADPGLLRLADAILIPPFPGHSAPPWVLRALERGLGGVTLFGPNVSAPEQVRSLTAALRAVEIEAEVVLKATKVDGIYDDDPMTNPKAKRFTRLDYLDLINKDLRVMDHTAVTLCRENNIPIIVFDLSHTGNLEGVIAGKQIGTFVGPPS